MMLRGTLSFCTGAMRNGPMCSGRRFFIGQGSTPVRNLAKPKLRTGRCGRIGSRPMSEALVLTERRDGVLLIPLNRPKARNAVNGALAHGVAAALDELDAD